MELTDRKKKMTMPWTMCGIFAPRSCAERRMYDKSLLLKEKVNHLKIIRKITMDRKVNGNALGGTVRAIPSKSWAHRLLICSALAEGESEINCPAVNEDIEATAACLNALGARITRI